MIAVSWQPSLLRLEALLGVPASLRESRESNSDNPASRNVEAETEDLGIEVLSTDWRQLGPTCAH
jgi:hypothetical protein